MKGTNTCRSCGFGFFEIKYVDGNTHLTGRKFCLACLLHLYFSIVSFNLERLTQSGEKLIVLIIITPVVLECHFQHT